MNKNVGGIDRFLRVALGIVLVLVGLFSPISGGVKNIVFIVAVIALFTGVVGFCPLWKILGINTCKACREK